MKHCRCFIERKVCIYWELNRCSIILYLNRHLERYRDKFLFSAPSFPTKTKRTINTFKEFFPELFSPTFHGDYSS